MLKGFAGSLLLCLFFLGEAGCAWLQPAPQIIAVEFVRDGSIPQAYRIEPPNCSYAELAEMIMEENVNKMLPGDIPVYDEELLWNFDIPDMQEPVEITQRKKGGAITITYATTEDRVIANFYPNGDYEIYAKSLADLELEEGDVLRVQEKKGGVLDCYFLRKEEEIIENPEKNARDAAVICSLAVLAVLILRKRISSS